MNQETTYSYKDFENSEENRWCPGCGDKSILRSMQLALPKMGLDKKDVVFISGIGCSSRFPYYMNSYGFHTIHGRAAAVATGVKLANPALSVWEITGDGDSLAIGTNHFVQAIRRNININILLFNNEIYGLTKGQFSPTSHMGLVTKSSPHGTVDPPFNPGELCMSSKCTFFARSVDVLPLHMTDVFVEAEKHKGTSVVELLQNCVIFNDKVFGHITDKDKRDENMLFLEHGKPMLFGKEKNKGIRLNGLSLEAVEIGKNGVSMDDILIHDAHANDPVLHAMLIRMNAPELPVAFGVIRAIEQPTFDDALLHQVDEQKKSSNVTCVNDLLLNGDTWIAD